jgi:hypothetical protein
VQDKITPKGQSDVSGGTLSCESAEEDDAAHTLTLFNLLNK